MTGDEHFDAQIAVRVTEEQYAKLEELSKLSGKTKSEIVREATEEKLKENEPGTKE